MGEKNYTFYLFPYPSSLSSQIPSSPPIFFSFLAISYFLHSILLILAVFQYFTVHLKP